jgi:uroporphyrinogen-III synthase
MGAPLEGLQIAITRPIEQSKNLARLIAEAGGCPIIFPLLEIKPLDDYTLLDAQIRSLADFDQVIFVSSNAVDFSLPRINKILENIPNSIQYVAIGPQTAHKIHELGITNVAVPEGRSDSEALLKLDILQNVTGKKIMIFRGVGGRDLLSQTLTARGAHVTVAESYIRSNPQSNLKPLQEIAQKNGLDAMVVTSSEAMRSLMQLARHETWLESTILCVNHPRIAEMALDSPFKIMTAHEPGDNAMLSCLIQSMGVLRA